MNEKFVIPAQAGIQWIKGRLSGDTVFYWMPGQARHDGEWRKPCMMDKGVSSGMTSGEVW